MNNFVLKCAFIKIHIYHFPINIFIKVRNGSYALEIVSLSKTTSFTNLEQVALTTWSSYSGILGSPNSNCLFLWCLHCIVEYICKRWAKFSYLHGAKIFLWLVCRIHRGACAGERHRSQEALRGHILEPGLLGRGASSGRNHALCCEAHTRWAREPGLRVGSAPWPPRAARPCRWLLLSEQCRTCCAAGSGFRACKGCCCGYWCTLREWYCRGLLSHRQCVDNVSSHEAWFLGAIASAKWLRRWDWWRQGAWVQSQYTFA